MIFNVEVLTNTLSMIEIGDEKMPTTHWRIRAVVISPILPSRHLYA